MTCSGLHCATWRRCLKTAMNGRMRILMKDFKCYNMKMKLNISEWVLKLVIVTFSFSLWNVRDGCSNKSERKSLFFSEYLLRWIFCYRQACIVVPSGEYVCNMRKNNTTHNLRALVYHVYDISKHDIFRTTVLEAAIGNAQFTLCDMFECLQRVRTQAASQLQLKSEWYKYDTRHRFSLAT